MQFSNLTLIPSKKQWVNNSKYIQMKKTYSIIFALLVTSLVHAQDFKKNISSAQTSYNTGKLQDAHFALLQMMQDLDITIGKEVLKLFPASMDSLTSTQKEESVAGSSQFTGVTIEKQYGVLNKKATLHVVINSPLLNSLNAYINSPMLAGFGGDPNTKIVKVNNYKARLTKEDDEQNAYRLEIPMSNALLSLKINNSTEAELISLASQLPIAKMAHLVQ